MKKTVGVIVIDGSERDGCYQLQEQQTAKKYMCKAAM